MTTPSSEAALGVSGLTKAFDGMYALRDVSIEFDSGAITALLGPNGSGKSTLVKLLAGFHSPDDGNVVVGGVPVDLPLSQEVAMKHGLRFVHQDVGLVDGLTVADNFGLALGFPARATATRINRRLLGARTRNALDYVGVEVDEFSLVAKLTPSERMLVAIARAFEGAAEAGANRVLVLDEPTAALPSSSVDRILSILAKVRDLGGSVVFVTHRIDEVLRVAENVVVLRDGQVAAEQPVGSMTAEQLATLIMGDAVSQEVRGVSRRGAPGEVVLSVDDLGGARLRNVNFEVRAGEILGVAGLMGCGKSELARMLGGLQSPAAGEIRIEGRPANLKNPRTALAEGVAFIPPDRHSQGCVMDFSMRENLTLTDLSPYTSGLRIDRAAERNDVAELFKSFNIRPNRPERPIRQFSGGNQQKGLIAKFVRLSPRLLVVDELTQGVDVGGREEIYEIVRRFAEKGGAVVLSSSSYDDLAALCHRVLVLNRGVVVGMFESEELDERRIAVLGTKVEEEVSAR